MVVGVENAANAVERKDELLLDGRAQRTSLSVRPFHLRVDSRLKLGSAIRAAVVPEEERDVTLGLQSGIAREGLAAVAATQTALRRSRSLVHSTQHGAASASVHAPAE